MLLMICELSIICALYIMRFENVTYTVVTDFVIYYLRNLTSYGNFVYCIYGYFSIRLTYTV